MSLIDEALHQLRGKQVVVVTTLSSEGVLQEVTGTLLDGGEGFLVLQEEEDALPLVVNSTVVAWIYEDTEEAEEQ